MWWRYEFDEIYIILCNFCRINYINFVLMCVLFAIISSYCFLFLIQFSVSIFCILIFVSISVFCILFPFSILIVYSVSIIFFWFCYIVYVCCCVAVLISSINSVFLLICKNNKSTFDVAIPKSTFRENRKLLLRLKWITRKVIWTYHDLLGSV